MQIQREIKVEDGRACAEVWFSCVHSNHNDDNHTNNELCVQERRDKQPNKHEYKLGPSPGWGPVRVGAQTKNRKIVCKNQNFTYFGFKIGF